MIQWESCLRFKHAIAFLAVMVLPFTLARVYALEADVTLTRFSTGEKAYIEMYMYILGSSVKTTSTDSTQIKASVNVIYYISRSGEVVSGDRFNLVSAGSESIPDFMDLRRIVIEPGSYTLTVELTDNNDTTNATTLTQAFRIDPSDPAQLLQSDILLLANVEPSTEETVWVRNGRRMTPLPYAWYWDRQKVLYFYQELYHSLEEPGTDFYISYTITPDFDSTRVLLEGFKRMKPAGVNSILQAIDIEGLTSGKYFLNVDVHAQSKELISSSRKAFFRNNETADQRMVQYGDSYLQNSFTAPMDMDSVRYALKAIAPVIPSSQVASLNFLLQNGKPANLRRFLHEYWVGRDPADPQSAYRSYMAVANAVDQEYHSAFGHGFETDRGRTVMKYGMPSDIISVTEESSAPPYEIWIYNHFPATRQTNVRFLFYNPSLAGGDYRLLHSTATGEIQNSRWEQILYSDAASETSAGDLIDGRGMQDNFNRRAVEYFND